MAYEALLTDTRRVLGPDHPDTLATRNNLASCRSQAGDRAGATAELADLLVDMMQILGPDHPYTRTAGNNLDSVRQGARERTKTGN
jgi:hypothetical protein